MCWGIIAGYCTQEPKFRSEIATSSPLFPMETTPSAPQHLLSSLQSSVGTAVPARTACATLASAVAAVTAPSTEPVTTQLPTATVCKPADDFLMYNKVTFVTGYLGRVVIFIANFFG